MLKISKLLYAIVNQILPVPKQILDYVYQKYQQFIESNELYCVIQINLKNKKMQDYYSEFVTQCFEMTPLVVALVKSNEISGGFNFNNKNQHNVQINCIGTAADKDVIQHELKHYFKYWNAIFTNQNIEQLNKFYNLQFQTYITDFCNLMTQIYKRLNRRFNVSLDTIVQKIVVDVVDNKTNINKYRSLFNGNSQFLCYKKCISLLQLYKGVKTNIDDKIVELCQQLSIIDQFKNKNKYNKFFEVLKQHVIKSVKKTTKYNINQFIENKDLKQLNLLIQKRVVPYSKLNDIIQLFIQNDKENYLINIAISYKLTTEQIDKIKNNLNELNKAKLEHQL